MRWGLGFLAVLIRWKMTSNLAYRSGYSTRWDVGPHRHSPGNGLDLSGCLLCQIGWILSAPISWSCTPPPLLREFYLYIFLFSLVSMYFSLCFIFHFVSHLCALRHCIWVIVVQWCLWLVTSPLTCWYFLITLVEKFMHEKSLKLEPLK